MPPPKPRKTPNTEPIDFLPSDEVLFGRSAAMMEVCRRAQKVCHTNAPVLLCGDGGTGKEALARWIHKHSAHCDGQFVKVNCAAIPGSLLESELFGYEKGAFTGAQTSKPGRVELAHNGTLFLDEISDLDMTLQSKLLQFLQDGCFSRIGGEAERSVVTRIVCATNKDLEEGIGAGSFRADLFYRINVVRLRVPRLRERREDIPVLAEYFRRHYQKQFAKECQPLSWEMIAYLQNLDWPGNVRELSNGIARYVLVGPEAVIAHEPTQKSARAVRGDSGQADPLPLKQVAKEAIREVERNVILETLRDNQWNRRKTAEALKISYRALIYKIRDAGLISRPSQIAPASRADTTGASRSPID